MKYTQIRTDLWYSFDIMRDTFKRFRCGLSMLAAAIFFSSGISVRAELIPNSFDETSRSHDLRRNVPVAINVYAKNGTVPQVVHEEGVLNGVAYDVLRVDPSEDTFIQVDYSPSAQLLYSLYDYDLVSQGYTRIGGINASFFTGGGCPSGAIRVDDQWQYYGDMELSPSYGNGFATAYFNNTDMELKYHGWQGSSWIPYDDGIWNGEQTGVHSYGISSRFAVSGSYTYFANGVQTDLTTGGSGRYQTTRAVSLMAQRADKQYLLMNFYGRISDWDIIEYLRSEGVTDAIKFDGGGSTQMVYEDTLVNLPYVNSGYSEQIDDKPLFGWGAVSMGYKKLEEPVYDLVKLDVSSGDTVLFEDDVPVGATLTIMDETGRKYVDHVKFLRDMHVSLAPTSSVTKSGTVDHNTLYYQDQEFGSAQTILRTGSDTEIVLVVIGDSEIPELDLFTSSAVSDGETVWTYTGRIPVELTICDENGTPVTTGTVDYDSSFELVHPEVEGMEFAGWQVGGDLLNIRIEPVYEKAEEPGMMDKISGFLGDLLPDKDE